MQNGRTMLFCGFLLAAGCSSGPANQAADTSANMSETDIAIMEAAPCPNVALETSVPTQGETGNAASTGSGDQNILTVLGGDAYRWNESPVDATTLRQNLDLVSTMRPAPRLLVRRDAAADDAAMAKARERIYLSLNCRAEL